MNGFHQCYGSLLWLLALLLVGCSPAASNPLSATDAGSPLETTTPIPREPSVTSVLLSPPTH